MRGHDSGGDREMTSLIDVEEKEEDELLQSQPSGALSSSSSSSSLNKTPSPRLATIRIKSFQDVSVKIESDRSHTIAAIKDRVLKALNVSVDRYIRLIHKGRLLAPDTATLLVQTTEDTPVTNVTWKLQDGDVIHAVLAAEGQRGGAQARLINLMAKTSSTSEPSPTIANLPPRNDAIISRRALRGTGLNEHGLAVRSSGRNNPFGNDESDEESSVSSTEGSHEDAEFEAMEAGGNRQRRSQMGFDRLRTEANLRPSQIRALRAYFTPHVDRWVRGNPERARQLHHDNDRRRRRNYEDAWMQTQGPGSEFRINLAGSSLWNSGTGNGSAVQNDWTSLRSNMPSSSIGTDRDFAWGFFLGFFVGFIMLVWVWMPTVPHKQKLGILTGISFQLAFSVMNGPDDTEDELLD